MRVIVSYYINFGDKEVLCRRINLKIEVYVFVGK